MTIEEITLKYKNVPEELKVMKRWVCFKVEGMEKGKTTKRPYNAKTGKLAKVSDELTWSNFDTAMLGCVKYGCDGIGFILGAGIFGIDLDNHPDQNGVFPMSDEEFKELGDEFINTLDSYAEHSQSGKGIHIICAGKLPVGARRKGCVEMYDSGRFFAFTGDIIHKTPINNREQEIIPLWEKYLNKESFSCDNTTTHTFRKKVEYNEVVQLTDQEVIDVALASKNGNVFWKYYHDGDISMNNNDASSADMSFCNILAFYCNGNISQMDRIFRSSALMRDKWDEMRGQDTYGNITLQNAASKIINGYTKTISTKEVIDKSYLNHNNHIVNVETGEVIDPFAPEMNMDENGEPIFRIKKNFNKYPYTDTGNAIRFYDYFGELFKYNKTDKVFMFWTGKTWIKDLGASMIRKYANKFIDILKTEYKSFDEEIENATREGRKEDAKRIIAMQEACLKNATRVANKAGKDAMLYEFQSLYDVPVESWQFDQDDYLLNTDSGIVDLKKGDILPFDKSKMLSKNTNIKVSFETPHTWIKFLNSVFYNGNKNETQEIVDSLQTCLGYSLTGSSREQIMFLLYGSGSNGKSTLTETISNIMGTYGDNIQSSILMQQKNANNSAMYSIAKLQNIRFVETGETDDGGKLAEAQLKILTGGDTISAQFKYGNEFSFKPKFKIWMSTNNKPIIRGTDLGIWRRLFIFPFVNSFTGENKDKNLPDKLKKEKEAILGWCIRGYQKYLELGENLIIPRALEHVKSEYKQQMDIIAQFIDKECVLIETARTECRFLYQYYKEWALDNTEFTMKESKFSDELKNKGIRTEKDEGKNFYVGIRVISRGYSNY